MLSVSCVLPDPSEDKDAICLHNMKEADKYRHKELMIYSATAWVKNDPSRNMQDLEKLLRENNLDTHIFASDKFNKEKLEAVLVYNLSSSSEIVYQTLFSCNDKFHALQDVIAENGSYEANFEKLKHAGILKEKNMKNTKEEKEPSSMTFNDKVYNSMMKISIKRKTFVEGIMDVLAALENKYKTRPRLRMIAMNKHGGPINAFVINNKIVYPKAFSTYYDEEGKMKQELVDVNDIF